MAGTNTLAWVRSPPAIPTTIRRLPKCSTRCANAVMCCLDYCAAAPRQSSMAHPRRAHSDFLPDLGSIFEIATWHEAMHLGQVTVIRRSLGNQPLFGAAPAESGNVVSLSAAEERRGRSLHHQLGGDAARQALLVAAELNGQCVACFLVRRHRTSRTNS